MEIIMKEQNDEITLKELFEIFIPKLWAIILVAVICAGALGCYSMFIKDDTYTSTASFIMVKTPTKYGNQSGSAAITTGLSASEIDAMQSMITMTEQIMKTNQYMNSVREALIEKDARYETVSVGYLRKVLSIKIVGEATVFDISAITTDPQLSYDITDVVYHTFPDVIRDYYEEYSISIKVIDPPLKAINRNARGTVRNAFIGGFAGAVLTALIVFVVAKLDIVIRNKEKLEQSFNIPVIGVIPTFNMEKK
jgi:capsular polysaccharide biosynthesis protein